MTTDADQAKRKRGIQITAIIVGLVALCIYVGFIAIVASR